NGQFAVCKNILIAFCQLPRRGGVNSQLPFANCFPYLRRPMYYNRKIALYTLGCKLNFSETSAIGRILVEQGYQKVDFSDRADYYIINTCSVTQNADKETRQVVKSALRSNPGAKVVIVGCYAQLKPEEIS